MTRARKTPPPAAPAMQRLTVTSGLKELKLLNKRIATRIENLRAIRTRRSSTEVVAGVGRQDFAEQARQGMQATEALLARRDAIKAEIVRSHGHGGHPDHDGRRRHRAQAGGRGCAPGPPRG